jgi:calcium-dependent protein kinase
VLGTPFYIAPEVLDKSYSNKCDIWSVGVITYILLCGQPPFYGENNDEIIKKVRIGKFSFDKSPVWSQVSDNAKDFIMKLMTYDQHERFSAA